MKRYLRWIVAAEFLFAAGNLHAVEVEVPGLLTDHTVSSIGHDFYRAFSDKWESDYTGNLTINERPSARWGSWITITVNQDVIFQTFLFPLKRDFEKTVVFALIQTEEALNRRQINQALLSTGDLAHDEFARAYHFLFSRRSMLNAPGPVIASSRNPPEIVRFFINISEFMPSAKLL